MLNSQIRRLSVISITLDHSFWVKNRKSFPNLFNGSKRVIVCSESSFFWSDVDLFAQDSTITFHWSVAALFLYIYLETFNVKVRFVRGSVIATVCLTTQTLHLRTSELFFEEIRLSLIILLVFHTTCLHEKSFNSISSETKDTVNWSHPLLFRS